MPGFRSLVLGLACVTACGGEPFRNIEPVPELRRPAWSADGQWLAMERYDSSGGLTLEISQADGTNRRILATDGLRPAWSPDGQSLAFIAGLQLYRLDITSGSAVALTTAGLNRNPAWSLQSPVIAFASNADNNANPPDLWLIQPDGSGRRRVPLPGPPRTQTDEPSWSPAGDRLVTVVKGGTGRLFITDTLGQDTAYITPGTADATRPSWSPDGAWIVYAKARSSETDLWLVRPDGTEDHLLVTDGIEPAWFPNSQSITFARRGDDEVALWSINLSGGGLTKLMSP